MTMQIQNPVGVQGHEFPSTYHQVSYLRCNAAVVKGDLVNLVWVEADREVKIKPTDTDTDDPALCKGVAHYEGGGVGDVIRVVTGGYAEVNIGAGAVAAGERVIPTATPGVADGVVADATTIEGDTVGVFLGDEIGTGNTAPCWID